MSYVTPKKNTEFIFYVSLISQANTKIMQANPTLAAGDFQVSTDDGAPSNLDTIPVVDADFTKRVKVTLSADEMNGDNITLIASDAAGDEWCDLTLNIQTTVTQIDDLAPASEYDTEMGRIDVAVSTRTKPADTQAAVTEVTNDVGITQAAADKVWGTTIRSLTTFGTLVADIATAVWGAAARTLTAFGLTVARVTLVDTVTENTDMRGTDDAGTAINLATVDTVVDAIKLKTDTINDAGALTWTYSLTDSVTTNPIADATVLLTTDLAGTVPIRTAETNSAGVATFYFSPADSGLTVYVFSSKAGYTFEIDTEVIN